MKIYFSAILKLDINMLGMKRLFNKEIKLINFKASKKQVRVPSIFLLYLASPFLRKVYMKLKKFVKFVSHKKSWGKMIKFMQDSCKL